MTIPQSTPLVCAPKPKCAPSHSPQTPPPVGASCQWHMCAVLLSGPSASRWGCLQPMAVYHTHSGWSTCHTNTAKLTGAVWSLASIQTPIPKPGSQHLGTSQTPVSSPFGQGSWIPECRSRSCAQCMRVHRSGSGCRHSQDGLRPHSARVNCGRHWYALS